MAGLNEKEKIVGVVDMEFTMIAGNEPFYTFLGEHRFYPVTNTIHKEDLPRFTDPVRQGEESFHTVLRMKDSLGAYHWFLMDVKKSRELGGKGYLTLTMSDVEENEKKEDKLREILLKYQGFLGLESKMYFEYYPDTDDFKVFWVYKKQEFVILQTKLEVLQEQCLKENYIQKDEEKEFIHFCHDLKRGMESFSYDITNRIFNTEEPMKLYRFKGMTNFDGITPKESIGIITLLDRKAKRIQVDDVLEGMLDPLTGLMNKRSCIRKIKSLMEDNDGGSVTICIMDLDDFKGINDTFGHMFGDRVLQGVAEVMKSVLGSRGIAGRFGGDEFFLIIDSGAGEEEVRRILFTIRNNMRWLFEQSQEDLIVTASVGCASFPKDAESYEELFSKADRALYLAKEKGKDRYVIYDEAKHGQVTFDKENQKIMELYAAHSGECNKTETMIKVFELLKSKGRNGLGDALAMVGAGLKIDRINIFTEPDLNLAYTWGYETWQQSRAGYMLEEDYLKNFDGQNVFYCHGIQLIDWKLPKACAYLSNVGVRSFLQCRLGKGSDCLGIISFEECKVKRKWSEEDIHNLVIISRFVEEALRNEKNRNT